MDKRDKTQKVKPHRDANAALRVLTALELVIQGCDWDTIAAQSGYASRGAAYNAVQAELDRRVTPKVDKYRKVSNLRLDSLLSVTMPLALGKPEIKDEHGRIIQKRVTPDLYAIDRVLRIEERRAKLMGLDLEKDAPAMNITTIRDYGPGAAEAV